MIPTRLRHHKAALIGLLVCYIALGFVYSLATPTFEAADELQHFLYVKQIGDGAGLPVQNVDGSNPAVQEASQPPLYYLAMTQATSWIDSGPLEQTYRINPHAMKGRPGAPDNKNMVIHGSEERAWRGTVLAVHVIRWLSLLMGGATILLGYATARRLAPARPDLALLSAASIAFLPGFLFISASVNNDNAVILLGSAALLLAVQLVQQRPARGNLIAYGVVAGLAAISKLSGLLALPLGTLALAVTAWKLRDRRLLLTGAAEIIAPALLIAGWWYARNWILYHDLLGADTMAATAGTRPAGFGLIDLLPEQEGFRWSFWGVFGGFNVIAARWVYWVYDLLAIAGVIGLALAILRWHPRWAGKQWWPRGIAALWFAMLFAGVVKWSLSTMGSQGRLLYPAIGVVTLALAAGWSSLIPARARRAGMALIALALGLLAIYLPFATIMPGYRQPAVRPASAMTVANPLMATFADRILLAGYTIDRRAAQAGGQVLVTLQWQTLRPMEEDYSVFVHVYTADGRIASQSDSYPGGGTFATSQLPPDVAIEDRHNLELPAQLGAGRAQVAAGLYNLKTGQMLPAVDGQGRPLAGAVPLGTMEIVPREDDRLAAAQRLDTNLGGRLELAKVLIPRDAPAEGVLSGELLWRAVAPLDEDYVVFVHMLGPRGLVAQFDAEPRNGSYPTSQWRPGDLIADRFNMRWSKLEPGRYRLIAGMYRKPDGPRLPVQSSILDRLARRVTGREVNFDASDAVSLGEVEVR